MSWLPLAAGGSISSDTVAIIALILTGLAGLISALVLHVNTGRTIKAERCARKDTLKSEEKRHDDQLAFQRGETDRAELRRIIDTLATQLFMADEALNDLWAVGGTMRIFGADPDLQAKLGDALARIRVAYESSGATLERLDLRLGLEGDTLVTLAGAMRRSAEDARMVVEDKRGTRDVVDRVRVYVDGDGDKLSSMVQRRLAFTSEARKFTGAHLHRDSSATSS